MSETIPEDGPKKQPDVSEDVLSIVLKDDPNFQGYVISYVIGIDVMTADGARCLRTMSHPESTWWSDRGMLECILDDYKGMGILIPAGLEDDE